MYLLQSTKNSQTCTPVGDSATFSVNSTNTVKVEWFFQNGLCSTGFCTLCSINYLADHNPVNKHELQHSILHMFNHTCNRTALHIYNITIQNKEMRFKLVQTTSNYYSTYNEFDKWYCIKSLAHTTSTPHVQTLTTSLSHEHFSQLKSAELGVTTPIVVTVIMGIICTGIGYSFYKFRRQQIL
ncbi:RL11 Family [Baboon cytomegalovirus]|nr:RL11 Family [Baboon cytomegalovirus]